MGHVKSLLTPAFAATADGKHLLAIRHETARLEPADLSAGLAGKAGLLDEIFIKIAVPTLIRSECSHAYS